MQEPTGHNEEVWRATQDSFRKTPMCREFHLSSFLFLISTTSLDSFQFDPLSVKVRRSARSYVFPPKLSLTRQNFGIADLAWIVQQSSAAELVSQAHWVWTRV